MKQQTISVDQKNNSRSKIWFTEVGDGGNSYEEGLEIDFITMQSSHVLNWEFPMMIRIMKTWMLNTLTTRLEKHGGIREPREHQLQDRWTVECHKRA